MSYALAAAFARVLQREEFVERRFEALRFLEAAFQQAFKEAVREQVHVFGEQAEHTLHQEVGCIVRFVPAITEGLGKFTELFGDFFGD